MITIADAGEGGSAWGGRLVLSREFYNPDTRDYIHIEAHEVGEEDPHLHPKGEFEVAFWVPDGNDGDHGFAGPLHHVVQRMQEYVPPDGFEETTIPPDAYC